MAKPQRPAKLLKRIAQQHARYVTTGSFDDAVQVLLAAQDTATTLVNTTAPGDLPADMQERVARLHRVGGEFINRIAIACSLYEGQLDAFLQDTALQRFDLTSGTKPAAK